jgi:hypothetical protein
VEWIGFADALRLGPSSCQIVDYKSGSPAPSHPEQLRIYALLWARDSVLNPLGRLADDLVLIYPGRGVAVPPPGIAELGALEDDLSRRSASATAALHASPPPANVGPETCQYCDVKQLCSTYWTADGIDAIREPIAPTERSLQVVVNGRRAPRVWELLIDADAYIPAGTALIGTVDRDLQLEIGCRVRFLDVRVSIGEDGAASLNMGPWSEVYSVPGSSLVPSAPG